MANPNSSAQRSFAAEPYDSVADARGSKQITSALAGETIHSKDGGHFKVTPEGTLDPQPTLEGVMSPYLYGAVKGVNYSGEAIQRAINKASWDGGIVRLPKGIFRSDRDIYLQYDAVLNPGFNPANNCQGRLLFEGAGQCDDGQSIGGTYGVSDTALVFDAGFRLVADKAVSPYPIRSLRVQHMTVVGETPGLPVVDFGSVHTNSRLHGITAVQKSASGHGVQWLNSWMYDIDTLLAMNVSDGGNASGTGWGVYLASFNAASLAGGMINLRQITSQGFGKGYAIGVQGDDSGSTVANAIEQISYHGIQALKCVQGFDIARGVTGFDGSGFRAEQCTEFGARVRGGSRNIRLNGQFSNRDASRADLVLGDNTGNTARDRINNVKVDANFTGVNLVGVEYIPDTASTDVEVTAARMAEKTSGTATAIKVTASTQARAQRTLRVGSLDLTTAFAKVFDGPVLRTHGREVQHLLSNGVFRNPDANGVPAGWSEYNLSSRHPKAGAGIDDTGSGASVIAYDDTVGSSGDAAIYQDISVPSNSTLEIKFWVKSVSGATTPYVQLTQAGASSPVLLDLISGASVPAVATEVTRIFATGADTSVRIAIRGCEVSALRIGVHKA